MTQHLALAGSLVEPYKLWSLCGRSLHLNTLSAQEQGFVVQPKRWIVERTLGWLNRERRLSKDYERKEESSEAFVYLGMIRLMARRLA